MEVLRLSVPPIDRLWQVLQEMIPDIDRRGSNHSFLPSSTLPASDTCAASIGLIGSSRTFAAHAPPATANATATPSTFNFVMTLLLACSAKFVWRHGSHRSAAGLVFSSPPTQIRRVLKLSNLDHGQPLSPLRLNKAAQRGSFNRHRARSVAAFRYNATRVDALILESANQSVPPHR